MNNILDAAKYFKNLTQIEYEFKLGRKGKIVNLNVNFQKHHFYHLAGLQYITDLNEVSLQNIQSDKLFESVLVGSISSQKIESSKDYPRIKDRVDYLVNLEQIFDSNDTVFKYDPNRSLFTTSIKGEYLMQNNIQNRDVFVFLDKENDGSYYCRSFFPKDFFDYSMNQSKWTVLSKTKTWKELGITTVLYDYNEEKAKQKAIKSQVQSQIDSFYKDITKNNVILSKAEYQKLINTYKIVNEHCTITINGKKYECIKGLAQGFADIVGDNQELKKELQKYVNRNNGVDYTD